MVSSYYLALHVITTVCSPSDLVGSVSSLCVWRCGHLLVLLLSVERYNGPPYIDFCPVPARHGCVLVVPAQPDFLKRFREALLEKRAVDLRWPQAQLPDLVQTRGKAQNGLHTHL